MLSPAWDAVIVQEPDPVMWTVDPAIVQLPLAANVTVKPEDAVALTVKSGSPGVFGPRGPNAIVWSILAIENVCGTSGAAL